MLKSSMLFISLNRNDYQCWKKLHQSVYLLVAHWGKPFSLHLGWNICFHYILLLWQLVSFCLLILRALHTCLFLQKIQWIPSGSCSQLVWLVITLVFLHCIYIYMFLTVSLPSQQATGAQEDFSKEDSVLPLDLTLIPTLKWTRSWTDDLSDTTLVETPYWILSSKFFKDSLKNHVIYTICLGL